MHVVACAGAGSRPARRSACGAGPARRSRSAARGRSARFSSGASSAGPSSFSVPWPGRRGGCMPPGPPKPPGAICANAGGASQQSSAARGDAERDVNGGWRPDHAADPVWVPSHSSNSTPPVAAGMQEGDHGGRARPGAASRRSGERRPPSASPARRPGRRPRSRRGAGPGRGARGTAPAPRCRRARRSRRRRRRPPAPPACRNATSVFCPATCSRAPAASPNKLDRSARGGVTIRDGDRDVIDSLDLDHWGRANGQRGVERVATYIGAATYMEPRRTPDD